MARHVTKVLVAMLLVGGLTLVGCSERKEQAPAPPAQEKAPEPAAAPAQEAKQEAAEGAKEEVKQEEAAPAETAQAAPGEGQALFERHCSACHADGGNIINANKTLKFASLEASGLAAPEAFVAYLRNPGPGMPTFSENALPDAQALQIAEYVLEAFKE
ncbi:c-type cytochrome [Geoalkalibacter sp.]|uniref:c-type cytochrome n=1 Tax=Geoalkalibacter sp. TaxID=3041440 RepID=UPI00272E1310|nr:c-type cytochrome [Geoalkalibacter sp.]